jgi:flavin reductase (DIM6/NTAB) family NADH-FMN oxidoreductase RutF
MDKRLFFEVMGTAPTAVTIVTTIDDDGRPRGMTVASVVSVSAEPPSLLISVDLRCRTLPFLIRARRFAINYLRGDRDTLSERFASAVPDRFAGVEWRLGPIGMPILPADSLSWLECRIEKVIESGDHVILIAAAEAGVAPSTRSRPLMYFRHRYEPWPGCVDDTSHSEREPRSDRG